MPHVDFIASVQNARRNVFVFLAVFPEWTTKKAEAVKNACIQRIVNGGNIPGKGFRVSAIMMKLLSRKLQYILNNHTWREISKNMELCGILNLIHVAFVPNLHHVFQRNDAETLVFTKNTH